MKKLFLAFSLLLFGNIVMAQSEQGLWVSAGIDKKISKKLSIDFSIENRWAGLADFHQTYFGEVGVGVKLHKNVSLIGYYRLINRRKDETSPYNQRHRFFGDLRFDKKIKVIELKYRFRYQNQFRDNDNELTFDRSYFRHKGEIALNTKAIFTPYVSSDWFYQIGGGFEEVRYKLGTDIKLSKSHRLDIGAFLSQPLGSSKDNKRIIFDLGYTFKF